jgi:hypothetical protein
MTEYEYVKGQLKDIEKKYNELLKKYKDMEHKEGLQRIEERYNQLISKKTLGKADWIDEIMIDIYRDVVKVEKDYVK